MSNGDEKKTPEGKLARLIQPQTFEQAFEMAKRLSQSALVPKAYQPKFRANMNAEERLAAIEASAASVVIAWEMGAEVGLSPMTALQSIAVIGGKPVMYGEAPLGVVFASGLLAEIAEEDDGEVATCIVTRKGHPSITRTFSMDEARKAKMYERDEQGNGKWIVLTERWAWQSWPKDMRKYRARGRALKDAFPDVLKGLDIGEAVRDMGDLNAPAGAGVVIETEKVEENVYAPRQKAPEPPSAASPVQPPEPAGSDEPPTIPAGGSIPGNVVVTASVSDPQDFGQEAPAKPRVAKPRPKAAAPVDANQSALSSVADTQARGPSVAQDRESGQGATAPPVEPVQGADAPPPEPAVDRSEPPPPSKTAVGTAQSGDGSTSFEINGTEYKTRGLTREQLLASFKLVPQVDRKVGKGTSRTMLMKMFTLQSRTELTEQQGAEFLAALEKALA